MIYNNNMERKTERLQELEVDTFGLDEAIEYGANLITANDPVTVLEYLRKKGLHD